MSFSFFAKSLQKNVACLCLPVSRRERKVAMESKLGAKTGKITLEVVMLSFCLCLVVVLCPNESQKNHHKEIETCSSSPSIIFWFNNNKTRQQ